MDDPTTPAGRRIPATAVRVQFARSSGPGGQHVNTSETKARVTIDLTACELPEHETARLLERLGPEVTATSAAQRSQWRNREEALRRALARIDDALVDRAPRRPTKPSAGAKRRRLEAKRRTSEKKSDRRRPHPD